MIIKITGQNQTIIQTSIDKIKDIYIKSIRTIQEKSLGGEVNRQAKR